MFDWTAAADTLYQISKKQLTDFFRSQGADDIYGIGFFSDVIEGVLLVANTEDYYLSSLRDFEAKWGATDREVFRWEIGNWQYPCGLFPSSSVQQDEFYYEWKKVRMQPGWFVSDETQLVLEGICRDVLARLHQEDAFSPARNLKGLTVVGHDDSPPDILRQKERMDVLLQSAEQQRDP
jgi:hypothetical protein